MKRRVAFTLIVAGLLMLIGLRLFAIEAPTPSQAGNEPLATETARETAPSSQIVSYASTPINASFGGFLWSDTNMNGVRDAGEFGLNAVQVELYRADKQGSAVLADTALTDHTGTYLFTNVAPEASYFIEVIRPKSHPLFTRPNQQTAHNNDYLNSDIDPLTGRSTETYLTSGEIDTSIAAGLIPTSACLPTIDFQTDAEGNPLAPEANPTDVWSDWGIQITSEGAAPHLFNHGNAVRNGGDYGGSGLQVASDISIAFDKARPVYGVRILDLDGQDAVGSVRALDVSGQPIGQAAILPYRDATSQLAVLAATAVHQLDIQFEHGGAITELIFCEPVASSMTALGGTVWRDVNANGVQDAGESGYANAAVELRDSRSADVLLAATLTDSAGRYRFDNLLAGTYQISVHYPNETAASFDIDGTPDGVASALLLEGGMEVLTVNFGFRPNQPTSVDFGDAPRSYGQAVHQIHPMLRLGDSVDSDSGAQPSASAETDDLDSNNDDDGVLFLNPLSGIQQVQITLFNNIADQDAFVSGWIDFNQDGDFDDLFEQIVADTRVPAATQQQQLLLNYQIPLDTVAGSTLARFRISSASGLLPYGDSFDGEVEDYQITLKGEYGDAPSSYGSPSHLASDSLRLGGTSSADDGAIHSLYANHDLSDDGILFVDGAQLQRGTTSQLNITALVASPYSEAIIAGWVDFNGDGRFDESAERILAQSLTTNAAPQTITTELEIPYDAVCGTTYARFRIGLQANGIDASGQSGVGEIEDYDLNITCDTGASIGSVIWHDANGNGQQDMDEAGAPNVTLLLYRDTGDRRLQRSQDVPVAATTTNAQGRYLFSDLAPASYFVVIEDRHAQLANYYLFDEAQQVELTTNEGLYLANWGLSQSNRPLLVGGRVWVDNGDGTPSSAEFGIVNATVVAHDTNGTLVASTQTDSLGTYQLALPANLELSLSVTASSLPQTIQLINTAPQIIPLDAPSIAFDHHFAVANTTPSRLSGQIWLDDNNRQIDTGELMLPAVTVELIGDDNGNGRWDPHELIIGTARSDSTGRYQFSGLVANDYLVYVSDVAAVLSQYNLLSGLVDGQLRATMGGAQTTNYAISLAANQHHNSADFNYILASPESDSGVIGDLVWYETDYNGVHDIGETGIANVRVLLFDQQNQLIRETATDASGHYLFTELSSGVYRVVVSDTVGVLNNYMPTLMRAVQGESLTIELSNGDIVMGADFGYTIGQLSLGDRVWLDFNGDGWQNEDDASGIAGVPLMLYVDHNHNRLLDQADLLVGETVSDAQGYYRFSDLRPSSYFVVIPQSALQLPGLGGGPTIAFSGENNTTAREDMPLDSNGIPQPNFGIASNIIDLIGNEIANQGRLNNTIDFGFAP